MWSNRIPGFLVILALAAHACGESASEPAAPDVTAANLNLLHGIFCPPESEDCRLVDRVGLTMEFVRASGCPDVITLQEIWPPSVERIEALAAGVCPFTYHVAMGPRLTQVDDELVLSRYPIERIEQQPLIGGFRRVLWTRIAHPTGPLDVYSTHLASGADGASNPCAEDCPVACKTAGAATIRECQAVQMAEFVERTHDTPGAALVTGDMNALPGSFVYRQFTERGWIDSYLAAGNPECDPDTGLGCTSGRSDEGLESPALEVRRRIDFIFLVPATPEAPCTPSLLPANGIGPGTQLWAEVPNPFTPSCGPEPEEVCWASNHTGVQIAYLCPTLS